MGGVVTYDGRYTDNGRASSVIVGFTANGFTERSDAINAVNVFPKFTQGEGDYFDPNQRLNDVTNRELWKTEQNMNQLVEELMNTQEYMRYTYGTDGLPNGIMETRDAVLDPDDICRPNWVDFAGDIGGNPNYYPEERNTEVSNTILNEERNATSDIFNSNVLTNQSTFTKALPPSAVRTTTAQWTQMVGTSTIALARLTGANGGFSTSSTIDTWESNVPITKRATYTTSYHTGLGTILGYRTGRTATTGSSIRIYSVPWTAPTETSVTYTYMDSYIGETKIAIPDTEITTQATSYTYIGIRKTSDANATPTQYNGIGAFNPNKGTYPASSTKVDVSWSPPSQTINVQPSAYTTTEWETNEVCPPTWNVFSTSHGSTYKIWNGKVKFCYTQSYAKTITKYSKNSDIR